MPRSLCLQKSPLLYSKYGGFEYAVMMMDREEWDDYRAWEGYDQAASLRSSSVTRTRLNTSQRRNCASSSA